jgi:FKBP-type peptidyl-prolyl cis-trans isomerase 2
MPLKEKDFIEIDYTGRLKEGNELFDTSDEKLAKENDIHSDKMVYGPTIICLGEGNLPRGLEKKLEGRELGKHVIELKPEEAFGKKNAALVRLVPMIVFIEQEIQPVPGLRLNMDGTIGTVKHVGGGRVLVDFNHPLAGKELVYEVNVRRVVTDAKEKINAMLMVLLGIKGADITVEGSKAKVMLEKELPKQMADELSKHIKEITGVETEFAKKEAKKKELPKPAAKETVSTPQ